MIGLPLLDKSNPPVVSPPLFMITLFIHSVFRLSAFTLGLMTIVSIVMSCRHEHHEETSQALNGLPSRETLAMIDSVQKAQQSIDPMKITVFLCAQRAQMLKQRVEKTEGLNKLNFMVMWGFEELKAGNSREAIRIFDEVLTMAEPMNIPGKEQTLVEVKKLKALAALRLGEQENCVLNHTSASCIIPIAVPGQHQKPEGSAMALEVYAEVLKSNPDDLTSRWLYNIAAMTLGKFPDDVPQSFQLPGNYFHSDVEFSQWTDIAGQLGLDRRGLAGGVAVEDFDRDGDLDIMVSKWGFNDQLHYYKNDGQGGFTESSVSAGLKGVTGGLNIRHTDYNNDGYADVLILRGAWFREQGKIPNSLLKNNGDGTFTDVTVQTGLYSKRPTQNAVWMDFDLDGWVDLFIGNESIPENGSAFNFPSEFYHNQKDGTFKEISQVAGVNINAFVKGSAGGDINNDGYPDLYVSILNGQNILLLNQSGPNGIKFKDISLASGTGEPLVSFPTWMFDYNNDGLLDIFVSAYSDGGEDLPAKVLRAYGTKDDPFRPRLYKNNGDLTFTDVSSVAGLTEPAFTMGSNYGDLDNDGYPDFYLGTGEPNLKSIVPNKMYRNREGAFFEDLTYAGGFGNIQKGHGVGFGDLDRDGDQDIFVVMGGSFEGDVYQDIFFENPNTNGHHWMVLQLEGDKSNRLAIGARAEVDITENGKTRTIHAMVDPGSSFGGNSLQLEIGLGSAEKIQQVKIHWPTHPSSSQVITGLSPDKAYTIREGAEPQETNYHYTPFKKNQHHSH